MGATDFQCTAKAKTPKEAFADLKERAMHSHGHDGYTGTIAEKSGFVEFDTPRGLTTQQFLNVIQEGYDDDNRLDEDLGGDALDDVVKASDLYENKWGPAVCVKTGTDQWTFIGLASE